MSSGGPQTAWPVVLRTLGAAGRKVLAKKRVLALVASL